MMRDKRPPLFGVSSVCEHDFVSYVFVGTSHVVMIYMVFYGQSHLQSLGKPSISYPVT